MVSGSRCLRTWAHPGGLAGELRIGERGHNGTSPASRTTVHGCYSLGTRFGRAALREDGQKDKSGGGPTSYPSTSVGRDEGHRNALWTRGMPWLRSGCVNEMEELSWHPSSLPGRHCGKRPVSRCRSPHLTDPWTPRNVHRSSLEETQRSARSAGPAQRLQLPARPLRHPGFHSLGKSA